MTTPQGPGDQRRADIKVHKDGTTWLVDCSGRGRGVPEHAAPPREGHGLDPSSLTPGLAAAVYSDIKAAKYSDQSNFVPFIVETGGRINTAGLEFFDKISGALGADTAQVRAGRRAALRGVTSALVRQQGYMLAQIVTEIHAPDLAVERRGYRGGRWWRR